MIKLLSVFRVLLLPLAFATTPVITISWGKGEPGAITEVWTSPDLCDWQLFAEVLGSGVQLPATQPAQYFKIRNRLGEEVSDWSRNQP